MNDDAGRFLARTGLKSDPEPAASFAGFPGAAGGHCVGEGEEPLRIAAGRIEALEQLIELQLQHRLEAFPAHITLCWTIKGIADRHVIGRDRLRHRSCRAADQEKPSCDFLAAANLGECSIGRGVEIYRQRLLTRSRFALIHDRNASCENWLLAADVGSLLSYRAAHERYQVSPTPAPCTSETTGFATGRQSTLGV